MRTRFVALAAVPAASLLAGASGTAGAASSGVVARGQTAWVTLDRAVAVVAATDGGTGQVAVTEGAVGFPISVSTTGATGSDGTVPDGDCVTLAVGGSQEAQEHADAHGSFAIAVQVPPGAVATINWSQHCAGPAEQGDKRCHSAIAHRTNPNRDEAQSAGQGCSGAGDAGPRS